MKFAKNGEYNKDALLHDGKSICQTMSSNDPVDISLIYVYIAKIQHEAMIEEKCKRNDGSKGSSQWALRLEKK